MTRWYPAEDSPLQVRFGLVWYVEYSPYAKVFVKSETTPKNTIFDLLYLNHHNSPTIENPVVHTQLIIEQFGAFTY